MNHDGRAVANYILDSCESHKRSITNLALQKIVYFCHVWMLLENGKPLIKHRFEAWQNGPVLQYLYHQFKKHDRLPITSRATAINPLTGAEAVVEYEFDYETRELLDRVINFYSRLSAGHLVELSHTRGGPWDVTWNHGGKVNPGMKIDDSNIIAFYSKAALHLGVQ